ncbi:MAG TPA: amino acid adenylation domain-containing protein, partial [Bacillota bacterium]|nr:amino acid adenylation domain-containing protein [Bacillota bacterium]
DLPLSGGAPQEIYQKEYEAPRDQTEQKLVAIWQKILRIDRIGINDDFFKLGGHSLNATTLLALIHKEFDVQMSLLEIFNAHTIKGLSKLIQHARQSEFVPIETVEKRGYYPTSSAQKRLFIVSQIEKKSTGYNIPGAVLIQGALDKKLVQQVFLKLIKRHETLRTSFEIIDGQPVSRVHPEIDFQIAYWDEAAPVRNGHDDEGADSKPRVQKIIRDFIRPFNLQEAPLMRVGLLRLENGDHLLLYDLHHIITDGISMNILVNEFAELYAGRTLPELRVQYKDYSVWQRRRLETEEIKEQEEYWIGKFQGDIPVLNLPTDFGRPAIQSFEGGRITFSLDEEITRKIKALGRVTGATLYMVLLALYNVLLMKYTEQEEIVVGTPIAGRSRADLENIIGMFVNTLALKNHPGPHQTFTEFLNQVKENALAAFANQDYQFEELVEKLDLKRDISRNPLFDVMFVLQNPTDTEVKLAGLNLSIYEIPDQTSRFDLTLRVIETGAGLSVNFEYCSKLWRRESIERMGTHFRNLVSDALVNPNLSLADIRLLTQDEQRRLLVDFNQTVSEYPKEKSLVELFEAQAGKNPDQVAVVSGAEQITYSVLNGKANQIARMLRNLGLKENCIAGILLEPSIEMVLAILGILKAGGAYLPIETTLPPERINYILEDSGAGILLTQANRLPQIEFRGKAIDIADAEIYEQADSNFEPVSTAKDLVYVIYTSGTTGRPKGVLLEHQSLVNYVTWFSGLNDLAQTDKTMLLASPCYDLGYTSLYPALAQGCELHIVAKELYSNPAQVLSYIRQHEITYLKMTPSLFNVIVNSTSFSTPGICATLRLLVLGGEKINVADLETYHQRYPQTVIMNHYGPTETTIGSVALKIDFTEFEKYQEHPVIGRPINNTGVYILDRQMQPTPMGVRGEIYISGAGLARGYLNRPELTAEKFVPIPFGGGTYRTGDLARYLPDGGIEYFGRTDHQVKIRGYRVEPGEIERTVLKHGSVKEAVVEVKTAKNDTKFLCLYVVTAGGLKASEIKEYLSQKLPDYLIPAFIIPMEAFPLTGNGKIDRRRLPDPDQESNRGAAYEAPRNNTEQALVEIWQGVLGVDHIGISDNFFDLGGHSLNGAILISRIQMEFKVDIPLSELFKTPTVKGLVAYITKADQSIYASIQPAPAQEHYRVSSAQKRMYLSYQLNPLSTAYNTPAAVMVEGKLVNELLERAFAELFKRHETLRTSFGLIAGEPVQVVHDQAPFQIQYHEADEAELKDVTNAFIKPFDLTCAPLLRVHLIKLKAQERYLLFMDMHHIVFDGVSRSLLISEFMELYRGKVLPNLKIQYKDFSEWQNDMVAAGMIKKQEEYWLQKLSGEIPALNMPTDYPRPAVKSFAGEELFATVEKELTQKINTLAKETGATLFMVLMAAYNILLSKYSGQEDVIVGAPVAGRPHVDLERIIGVFINTLALRNYPNRNKSIREFIAEVKLTTLDALENQDCQFERLVEMLDVSRDSSRNPLFDTMFIMQNIAFPNLTIDNLVFKPYNCARKDAKFDFKLEAYENNGIIGLKLDYATQVYKQETMERFLRHFIHLLEQMVQNPEAQIGSLEILTVDRGEIISNFNDDLENDYSFATYN